MDTTKLELFGIDIFSGCGGLTKSMHQANFKTKVAFEIDEIASKAYRLNHPNTTVLTKDIRKVSIAEIKKSWGQDDSSGSRVSTLSRFLFYPTT